jgi:hypothetical protein
MNPLGLLSALVFAALSVVLVAFGWMPCCCGAAVCHCPNVPTTLYFTIVSATGTDVCGLVGLVVPMHPTGLVFPSNEYQGTAPGTGYYAAGTWTAGMTYSPSVLSCVASLSFDDGAGHACGSFQTGGGPNGVIANCATAVFTPTFTTQVGGLGCPCLTTYSFTFAITP